MDISQIIKGGKSYVYDNHEVILTGRKAIKEIINPCVPNSTPTYDELWEIEPIDPDVQWKLFVHTTDLYEITKD